jgi:hypothetical protein
MGVQGEDPMTASPRIHARTPEQIAVCNATGRTPVVQRFTQQG